LSLFYPGLTLLSHHAGDLLLALGFRAKPHCAMQYNRE
jgi:hypothetical protein